MSRTAALRPVRAAGLPPRALLAAAAFVAAVATAGSLYLSLGLGLVPCELCWYQRILMYPLVVVLGVAAVERRPGVWRTALPLALSGAAVAAYHVALQLRPAAATCSISAGGVGNCGSIQYTLLDGLLTIPRLSLLAFLLVAAATVAAAAVGRASSAD